MDSSSRRYQQRAMHEVGPRQRNGARAAAPPIARNAEAWGWQMSALCRGTDPSVFFHPDGERGLKRHQRKQSARRLCSQCPVVMQCLDYSLRFHEPYGIWGGIAEDERHKILQHTTASARDKRSSIDQECLDDQAQQSVPAVDNAGNV